MMKKLALLISIVLLTQFVQAQEASREYETLWTKVENYELNDLPKSALALVDSITSKAKKEKNSTQIVKALLYTSKFSLVLEEDAQLKIVNDFKTEIAQAEFPTKNILENYLAKLYWQYYQQNRYRFYDRTKTDAKVDSVDFRTWDLNTLFNEINARFDNSLARETELQKFPVSEFELLLHKKADSEKHRPTLFDVLAHSALDFYKTSENSITRPADKFEINQPDYMCEAAQFSQQKIKTTDTSSLQAKALIIYQKLIDFHLKNNATEAIVEIDLERLKFIRNNAVFSDKDKQFLEVLKNSASSLKQKEHAALYQYEMALLHQNKGQSYDPKSNDKYRWKLKQALEICNAIIEKHPKSRAAKKCASLKSQLLKTELQLTAEEHIPINTISRVLVNYKNIDSLNFRALKVTDSKLKAFNKIYERDKKLEFLNKLKVAKAWSSSLKNEKDYQTHSSEVSIPVLPGGTYLLFVETADDKNTFAYSELQVTNIALTELSTDNQHIYQVVNRNDGSPVPNAQVKISYSRNYNRPRHTITKTTNQLGQVFIEKKSARWSNVQVAITHLKDSATFGDYYITNKRKESIEEVTSKAFVFNDRSIYRPGQTVYFKGILVETFKKKSTLLTDELVDVILYDVNDDEVAELEYKTNEYGSFSGEIVLPNNGLTGQYYLEVDYDSADDYTEHYFSVEEYKRPKFETSFKPVTETYKVNDSILVQGTATAYAGSSISDAKVSYRVKRMVQYPRWYYWYRPYFSSEAQEITHGETTTDDSGLYKINFKAIPDASVDAKNLPVFRYEVTADVTDINGETHSTSTIVSVGYHAVTANLSINTKIDKDLKDNSIAISTLNLNGQPIDNKGVLKMYKLQAPEHVLRDRPWKAPDYDGFTQSEFKKLYPHDAFKNEHDYFTWEKGKLVWEANYDTSKSKEIELGRTKKWTSGKYIIELETKDKFGQLVKDIAYTTLSSTKDKMLPDHQLFEIKTDKLKYKPGDDVTVLLSTAAENLNVMVYVEKKGKLIDRRLVRLNQNTKSFKIPVTTDDYGGFSVSYGFTAFNSFKSGAINIRVPYPKKELEIETATFRDKLQPGIDETWAFKIKGAKGEKVTAELLANMYDASLDAFKGHWWNFNPLSRPLYYPQIRNSASQSFGTSNFNVQTIYHHNPLVNDYSYDSIKWFGLSLGNNYYQRRKYLASIRESRSSLFFYKDDVPEGYVNGEINDQDGLPLPGVNIMVKGTTNGTTSDFDGNFSIQVKEGQTLVFSFIGLLDIEKKVSNNNFFKIYMEENSDALEEVVVVGYGSTTKKSVTGSVTRVASEDLEVDQLLEGKVAGVNISSNKDSAVPPPSAPNNKLTDFTDVKIRKNLQENAFFFPHLKTDAEGNVNFSFTTPEALTKWNVQLLAHTKNLESSIMNLQTVTQKELMVIPNAPRFLREGDEIIISTKIANLTKKALAGQAKLELVDAVTGQDISKKLMLSPPSGEMPKAEGDFEVDSLGNTQVSWKLSIPDGIQAVQYKVIAKAGDFSDGEQNMLPVLTNRMLVTETLPMWVRSNQTKTFTLDKLKTTKSTTLKHHKLTLEMTSNPAWYAVQALPYLMEYPYECNEQTFSRYYANTLASHIANSNPRIQEVFNQWANSDALLSNLEKNQELKSLLIQETPWLRDAQSETEQKKRIALLFNLNKMNSEQARALKKLQQNQKGSGAWSWFKGGRENRYITQHIATGFGHLKHLSVTSSGVEMQSAIKKAVAYLDSEFVKEYNQMKKYADDLNDDHLSRTQIHYLYMRSFFKDIKTSKKVDELTAYYHGQARNYWKNNNLYTRGMLALIMHRADDSKTAEKILRALEENSITSEELGMYWKSNTSSWYWYQAPIETQALLIETFSEINPDDITTIDNLKIWLLKNKQTSQWKTTKATTEAVYALLLQGNDWLSVTDAVEVLVGGEKIEPSKLENVKVEAGTGYYKTAWNGSEVQPKMAEVQIAKKGDGIAWGALYWQYFEDLDKITSAETPLKLKKKLFLKKNTDTGEEISEITPDTSLKVGDLVRVRIELKADRAMEFVHMKDMRAASFEPINVISRYKWQDGLGYYEATKDASTNFFFDYLPKGVYVFEYDLRVNNAGNFSNGITTIQSMYAPEFSSHSEGVRVNVN